MNSFTYFILNLSLRINVQFGNNWNLQTASRQSWNLSKYITYNEMCGALGLRCFLSFMPGSWSQWEAGELLTSDLQRRNGFWEGTLQVTSAPSQSKVSEKWLLTFRSQTQLFTTPHCNASRHHPTCGAVTSGTGVKISLPPWNHSCPGKRRGQTQV